jgi:cytochrome c-type biogenesis protein CcmE
MKPKYVIALALVAGALLYLVLGGLGQNLVYFITPSEYFQQADRYQNRQVRLGGLVKEGSLDFSPQTLELRFVVSDGVKHVPVKSSGSTPPAMFGENRGVVVEGRFQGDTFVSQNLLVKHSETYTAPKDGWTPEQVRKLIEEAN